MRTLSTVSLSLLLCAILAAPLLAFAQADDGFVPLTNLPGLSQTISSDTLPDLLNQIYRLCIGAAAVIAVLQIMRAGAYFMFNKGSVAHNEKAKSLIQNSVLGLLLVLSPAIVFGIINRDILNLRLDFTELQPKPVPQTPSYNSGQQEAMCQAFEKRQDVPDQPDKPIAYECSLLGKGWAETDSQCCNITGNARICCGYSPSNDTNTPAPPAENSSGTFFYDYVVQEKDLDTGAACTDGVHSRSFDTAAKCSADAAASLPSDGSGAIRNRCTSPESYSPSKTRFDQINALPTCSE